MALGILPAVQRQSIDRHLGSDQLTMVLGICAVELPYDRVRTQDLRATARIDVGTRDLVLDPG